jgi:vitamin B12 transporter
MARPKHVALRSLALALPTSALAVSFAEAQVSPLTPAEEIVVTSSLVAQPRRQIGTAVSVLDAAEIELRGYNDLVSALRTQPGIGISNSGGAGKPTALRIRGEEHYRTLLVIDGVKAVDPSAPQAAPSFETLLATTDLERVEVLRGPQGFIYGADAGGVVNVLTKRGGGDLGARLGLEYGEFATRKLDAALSGGDETGDYFISVSDLETDGFNAQSADMVLGDDDGAANTTLHAKLGWEPTDALRLQLVARGTDAENHYDGCGFPTVYDCRGTTEQSIYKLSAEHTRGALSNVFGVSQADIARADFATGAPAFATDGELGRVEYMGTFKPSAALALVYGIDFLDEKLVAGIAPRSRDQRGYYVEYQGAFADAFFVTAGARYDDNDDFGGHTSSRVSAAYVQSFAAGRSLKYRASVGTGFRAPSLYEVAYNVGPFASPPAAGGFLQEENSEGYDLGIEYDLANGTRLEVTFFDQQIQNEIFFDLVGFSGYLQSPGTSTSKGIEVGARVPLGERFELNANWTNNDAESSANEQRLRRPKNLGNVGLRYRSASERLNLLAHYRLARDSLDIGGVALDDYEVLDFSASFAVTEQFEVHGRVQNAADETYQEILGYSTAGRAAYAGVRMRF